MLKETGERQVKPFIKNIDLAHRERYSFAAGLVGESFKIADIGCGIGYGSYIMATTTPCAFIKGIDISEEAILYAKENYYHQKIKFIKCNILQEVLNEKFNLITAFEVVEHVESAFEFICALKSILEDDGMIVLTTPNEDVLHFDKADFSFHVRHYRPGELQEVIEKAGLEVILSGSQNGRAVYAFEGNAFNVFVCRKKGCHVEIPHNDSIQDAPITRIIADYERIDWLLENLPKQEFCFAWREILNVKLAEEQISDYILTKMDYHRRIYSPQTLEDNPGFDGTIGEITEGMEIKQSFIAGMSGICGIAILPGLFGTKFVGQVNLSVYDEMGNLIGTQSYKNVNDNQLLTFNFLPQKDSKGKRFTLEMYVCSLDESTKITLYKTNKKQGCTLKISDSEIDSTLSFRTKYI